MVLPQLFFDIFNKNESSNINSEQSTCTILSNKAQYKTFREKIKNLVLIWESRKYFNEKFTEGLLYYVYNVEDINKSILEEYKNKIKKKVDNYENFLFMTYKNNEIQLKNMAKERGLVPNLNYGEYSKIEGNGRNENIKRNNKRL